MTLRTVVVSILALASIAVSRYLLNNGLTLPAGKQNHPGQKLQQADQRSRARQAEEARDTEMLHCLAVVEAEYVSDLDREYNPAKVSGKFRLDGGNNLNPEIQHRIEQKKATSASNCQKEYGQTPSPAPSP